MIRVGYTVEYGKGEELRQCIVTEVTSRHVYGFWHPKDNPEKTNTHETWAERRLVTVIQRPVPTPCKCRGAVACVEHRNSEYR
jgi:hypothetical protein